MKKIILLVAISISLSACTTNREHYGWTTPHDMFKSRVGMGSAPEDISVYWPNEIKWLEKEANNRDDQYAMAVLAEIYLHGRGYPIPLLTNTGYFVRDKPSVGPIIAINMPLAREWAGKACEKAIGGGPGGDMIRYCLIANDKASLVNAAWERNPEAIRLIYERYRIKLGEQPERSRAKILD